jgi:hypothetical protein
MSDTQKIRRSLAGIAQHCPVEMANIPLAAAWPMISRLVEAVTYADAARRSDAIERFTDDLVRQLNDCRQRIRACDAVIAAEDRKAARLTRLRAVGGE